MWKYLLIVCFISIVYSSSNKEFLQNFSHDDIKYILEAKYSVNVIEKLANHSVITKWEEENQKHDIFKSLNHHLSHFNHEHLSLVSIDDIISHLKTSEEHTSDGFFE